MKRVGCIKYSLRRYDRLDGNFTQISNDIFKLTNGNEFKVYCYLCSNYNRELGLIKISKFECKLSKYTNNIYKIFIPIIVQDEMEDQEEKEIREVLDSIVKETEGKIYTFTFNKEE